MNIDNALKLQRIIFSNPERYEEFISALEDVLLKVKEPEVKVIPFNPEWPLGGCAETGNISVKMHRQLVSKLQEEGYTLPSKTNIDDSFWNNRYVGVNEYGDITHYSDSSFFGGGDITIYPFTSDWVQHYLKGTLK